MKAIPIFAGSCERSGTTLLGSMLSNHSQILYTPESNFFFDVLHDLKFDYQNLPSREVFEKIIRHPRFKIWNIDIAMPEWAKQNRYVPYSTIINYIITVYIKKAQGENLYNYRFWVNHTPANIKYASVLFDLYPQSKMIHLVRNGKAVAASLLRTSWGPKSMLDASKFWLTRIAMGLGVESKFGTSRVLRIYYEDLVTKPEQTLQTIYRFLDLDFEPFNAVKNNAPLPAFNRISHQLVGTSPVQTQINLWKQQLTPRQVELFEFFSGYMLDYLGYQLEYGINARPMNSLEMLHAYFKKFLIIFGEWITKLQLFWFGRK